MKLKETLISSEQIFEGKVVGLTVDTVQLPNEKTATREVVKHSGAVAILAVTKKKKVILVEQFRYATGETLYEVPAGKLDIHGEMPDEAALRELAEETPYTAKEVVLLQSFFTSPGFCNEKIYLYRAKGVKKNSELELDEDEFINVVKLTKKEVKKAIRKRKIQDAKTLIALQSWLLKK